MCGLLVLVVIAGCSTGMPRSAQKPLEVVQSFIPVPPIDTAAAYVVIRSHSQTADRLVSVTADVTSTVELHQTRMDGAAMTMALVKSIDLPAGGELRMEPGGYHCMLVGLTRQLRKGDHVAMTFTFERAGTISVDVPVVDASGEPESGLSTSGHQGHQP